MFLTAQGNVHLQPALHQTFLCLRLQSSRREFYSHQTAWVHELLLVPDFVIWTSACFVSQPFVTEGLFYNIFSNLRPCNRKKWTPWEQKFFAEKRLKHVGLCEIRELLRPRRAIAEFLGPPPTKIEGAPPPTQWRWRRALLWSQSDPILNLNPCKLLTLLSMDWIFFKLLYFTYNNKLSESFLTIEFIIQALGCLF